MAQVVQSLSSEVYDDVTKWEYIPRYFPLTKARDAEFWYFLWSALEYTVEQKILRLVIWNPFAFILKSL